MASLSHMKNYLLAKGMQTVVPLLSAHTPDALGSMVDQLSRHALGRMKASHRGTADELARRVDAAEAFYAMAKRMLPRLSKNTQRRLVYNAFFNAINLGDEKRDAYFRKHGEYPPFFLLMSPSMACDLRCFGCYAWKHPKDQALTREQVSGIIRQAKEEMGIYFFSFTGGEPTHWPPLEEIAREHDDCFFMVYTHGQSIDEDRARRYGELGNIYPAISIEGDEALTDERRGAGAHRRILDAMDRLAKHGVLFGFSLTHTAKNHAYTTRGDFLDAMIAHGAAFGWVFQYIPIGREPDFALLPTAEMRMERREAIQRARKGKPILVYDFWNDGDAVDGCIAWGRKYVHITARGYVEPCVFVHFAKDNVLEKPLGECIRSACFRDARGRQPFTHDLRRPCPQIDHPGVLRELVARHGMFPTHEGAEDIIGRHYGMVCRTAAAFADEIARDDVEHGREAPESARARGMSAEELRAQATASEADAAGGCAGCGCGCATAPAAAAR